MKEGMMMNLFIVFVLLQFHAFNAQTDSFTAGDLSSSRIDLLSNIGLPLPANVDFRNGWFGFSTFDVKENAKLDYLIKNKFSLIPSNFSIRTMLKMKDKKGGYLFAITNGATGQLKVGLRIERVANQEAAALSLFWAKENSLNRIAHFVVPSFYNKWTRLAISSVNGEIVLYSNCSLNTRKYLWNFPNNQIISPSDTLHIAGRGNGYSHERFVGLLQELEITFDPSSAAKYCEYEITGRPDLEREGSGFETSGDGSTEGISLPSDDEGNFLTANPTKDVEPPTNENDNMDDLYGGSGDVGSAESTISVIPEESKGSKGEPGEKGSPGNSVEGQKGESGQKGEPGRAGDPGLNGVNGSAGAPGKEGERGEKGEAGDQGLPGVGIKGDRGESGINGSKGEPGKTPDPIPGPVGPVGGKGEKGEPGNDGEDGEDGSKGERGDPGKSMQVPPVTGPPGPPGLKGERGEDGVGLPGDPGLHGEKGDKGDRGAIGFPGKPGADGINGSSGVVGPEGPRGHKGEPGVSGSPGLPGIPGPPGVCFKKSGAPSDDEDGEGSGEIGSESGCASGKIGLPGPPGPAGATGLQGLQGVPGQPGPRGLPGYQGEKGEQGLDGNPGISGEKGEAGTPGSPGIQGERGLQGQPGINGLKGENGSVGNPGASGVMGPPGPPGLPGRPGVPGKGLIANKGEKGEPGAILGPDGNLLDVGEAKRGLKGSKGARGLDGNKGDMGIPGRTGRSGRAGSKGEKGQDGEPGIPGVNGVPGTPGLEGPPGPPGTGGGGLFSGSKGEKGDQGLSGQPGAVGASGKQGHVGAQGVKGSKGDPAMLSSNEIVPKIFNNTRDLFEQSSNIRTGTLAFVLDQEEVYIKTSRGWGKMEIVQTLNPNVEVSSSTIKTYPNQHPTSTPRSTTSEQTTSLSTSSPPTTTEATTPEKTTILTTEVPTTTSEEPTTLPVPSYTYGLRLIALNYPLKGYMRGIRGADNLCFQQSRSAGYKGTFRAFLSSRDQHLHTVVNHHYHSSVPIVNALGEILYSNWKEMFNRDGARVNSEKIYSFDKSQVMHNSRWSMKNVWHGSYSNGNFNRMHNCASWYTQNTAVTGMASPLSQNKLLGTVPYSCQSDFIVLCIENSPRSRRFR